MNKQIKEVAGYQYESIEWSVAVIAINMHKLKKCIPDKSEFVK